MAKRVLSVLLSVALLLCVVPLGTLSVSAETSGDYTYSVSNGEVTVTGYLGAGGDVVIPDTLGGYPVTGIDGSAFEGCSSLTSVTIPEGVTSIGTWVFSACKNLTSVTIPEGVASIGYAAFTGCENLTSITIPDSVTDIGDWAFEACSSLTSITIPDSVTSIGYAAFYECSSLTSVTIGSGVTSIGAYAFNTCGSLTSITVPDSVTSIEIGAFAYCSSLASVTIPDSVTSIVDGAFYDCNNLSDVWYDGSESQKDAIAISESNENLTSATWHYAEEGTESDKPTITEILIHPDVSNGVKLLVLYSDGTTQEVTDGYTIDDFDPTAAGEQQLSITYMDFTQVYTVTFDKPPIEVETVLIDPDVSNGINVTIVYADSTTQPIATGYIFDDFDPTVMGEQTVTLTYYGVTKDILVKAQDPADVIEYISGDVNGDEKINNKDLGLLLQYLNNWDVEVVELACDVNRDGKINNKDLGILLQYLNGWDVELK